MSEPEPLLNTVGNKYKTGGETDETESFESLDTCLEHLGGTGRYQISVLIFMLICKIFPGMVTLSAVFTNGYMSHTCSPDWISSTFSNCSVSVASDQCMLTVNCSATDIIQIEKCQSWDYDKSIFTNTITSHYNLVCDRSYLAYFSNLIFFIGFMFGCIFYGVFSDRYGRLNGLYLSSVNLAVCTLITSWFPVYWAYLIGQFLIGLGNGGLLNVLYTYALENTTTKYRSLFGSIVHNGWTVGILVVTMLAYMERDFQWVLFYMGLSILVAVPLLVLLYESPRWLFSMKKFRETDSVLHRIARINKRKLSHSFSSKAVYRACYGSLQFDEKSNKYNMTHLFRTPGLRKVTLITWFLFCTVFMAYFGISMGLGGLGGNIFMNQVYSAAIEPFGNSFGMVTSYCIGRRTGLRGSFALGGVGLIATAVLLEFPDLTTYRIAAAMFGKFWIVYALFLVWLYTAEVFPTVLRNIGVGMGSTMARVGGALSQVFQLLTIVWLPLPYIAYAAGPVLVFFVMIWAPETQGKKLPETVEEAEVFATLEFGRKENDEKA